MIPDSNEKKDRIDVLKDVLYSKNEDKLLNRRRHILKDKGDFYDTPTSWEEEKNSAVNMPYAKILLGAFIFFIVAFGFAFYKFWGGSNTVSGDNIDILVSGPVSVSGGDEFSLDINVKNNNNVDLQVVDLHVEYPDGTRSADDTSVELKRYSEGFGDIKIGESKDKIVKAVLFGEENSQKVINISVDYRISGSNAVFNKQKDYTILVSSSPVNIKVSSVSEVNSNQQVDFQVDITSNSLVTVSDLILKVDYPFGFNITSTNPKSVSSDNSVFDLGDLEPGGKRTIKISGIFQGQDGEDRILKFAVGTPQSGSNNEIGTIFTSDIKTISIKKSFVDLSLSFNGNKDENVPISTNSPVRADITWKNNLTERLYNMIVEVKISGNTLDKNSVSIDGQKGFYSSHDDTIIFDKDSDSKLSVVEPGDSDSFSFTFSSFGESSKPNTVFSNSDINVEVVVLGSRISTSEASNENMFSDKKVLKLSSDLRLLSRGYRTIGPFENTGPLPPKVDNESTYTITWVATNSFNNINNAKVSAFLPPNVRWTSYTSPDIEKISFNQETGEIVWNIGDMKMSIGDKNPARSVSFQVSVIPSTSQLGEELNLLNEATISGVDSYSGARIGEVRPVVTTKITSDPVYTENIGRVIE